MAGRFLIFGVIVSVLVHAAFLVVLSVSSTGASQTVAETASEKPVEQPVDQPVEKPVEKPVVQPKPPAAVSTQKPKAGALTLPDAKSSATHEPAPTPEAEWVTYTVKRGDMLERLVKRAGCSVSEAARYNKTTVKKLSDLKAGQKIKLPKFKDE